MYPFKYGEITYTQLSEVQEKMRKQIFFLLLTVDPACAEEYENVNVYEVFENLLDWLGGLNGLLDYPSEYVSVMALVYAAFLEYQKPTLNWMHYRKLILDAGSAVKKIKEGGDNIAEA